MMLQAGDNVPESLRYNELSAASKLISVNMFATLEPPCYNMSTGTRAAPSLTTPISDEAKMLQAGENIHRAFRYNGSECSKGVHPFAS
jgi:hypothetical protein